MLVIESVVELLTDYSVVEADAEVQKRDYWLVYLDYQHITATLFSNGGHAVGDPMTPWNPDTVLEGPSLWYVPDGTPVETASFLSGWMIGRAGAPPQPSPATQLPGLASDQPAAHGSGNISRPSEWFSPSAFFAGQHRARLDPDEWTG